MTNTPHQHPPRHGQTVIMHLMIAAAVVCCSTWQITQQRDPALMPGAVAYDCGYPAAAAAYADWPTAAPLRTKLAYFVRAFKPLVFHTHLCHWSTASAMELVFAALVIVAAPLLRLGQRGRTTAVAVGWITAAAAYPLFSALCISPGSGVGCSEYSRPSPAYCPSCTSMQTAMQVGGHAQQALAPSPWHMQACWHQFIAAAAH